VICGYKKMSWQAYIDTQLKQKATTAGTIENCIEHGAIADGSNGQLWAHSEGFGLYGYSVDIEDETGEATQSVAVNEFETLSHLVTHGTAPNAAGIRLNNEKYMIVHADGPVFYLKKKNGGACVYKTKTAIVFASFMQD
jgi:hypothetical protein